MSRAPSHFSSAVGSLVQVIQRIANRLEQNSASGCELNSATGAREKHSAKLALDLLDLGTDGRRGQPQLFGGTGEVQMSPGCFQRPERSGTREHSLHILSNY